MMKKYTDEQLISYLKKFHDDVGKAPTQKDFNNSLLYPHSQVYIYRFGCWNDALKLAGLKTNKMFHEFSDEELLELIKIFHDKNNKVPTTLEFDNSDKYPYHRLYSRRFGSWNNAIELAGYTVHKYHYTESELIDILKEFYERTGRIPLTKDFSKGPPGHKTYRDRFGSWNNALKLAGFDNNMYRYQDVELLDKLVDFYIENWRVPTSTDFNKYKSKYPHYQIYKRRFGSWRNALILAGLDENLEIHGNHDETELEEYEIKPWKNKESLFCSPILGKICKKKIPKIKGSECDDNIKKKGD